MISIPSFRVFFVLASSAAVLTVASFSARSEAKALKTWPTPQDPVSLDWYRQNPIPLTLFRVSNFPNERTLFESMTSLYGGQIWIRLLDRPELVECSHNGNKLSRGDDTGTMHNVFEINVVRGIPNKVTCSLLGESENTDSRNPPASFARILVKYVPEKLPWEPENKRLEEQLWRLVTRIRALNQELTYDYPVTLASHQEAGPKDSFKTTYLFNSVAKARETDRDAETRACSSPLFMSGTLFFLCDQGNHAETQGVYFWDLNSRKFIAKHDIAGILSSSETYPLHAKFSDGTEYGVLATEDGRVVAYSPQGEPLYDTELSGFLSEPIQVGDLIATFSMDVSVPNYPAKNRVYLLDRHGSVVHQWARVGESETDALLVDEKLWIGARAGKIEIYALDGRLEKTLDLEPAARFKNGEITHLSFDLEGHILAVNSRSQLFRVKRESHEASLLYVLPNQEYDSSRHSKNGRDRVIRSKPVVFKDGRMTVGADDRLYFLSPNGKLERIVWVGGFDFIQGPLTKIELDGEEALWVGASGSGQIFTPGGTRRYIHEVAGAEYSTIPALIPSSPSVHGPNGKVRFAVGVTTGVRSYEYQGKTQAKAPVEVETKYWTEP